MCLCVRERGERRITTLLQPGVNAPGTPKSTPFLPLKTSVRFTAPPGVPSNSTISDSLSPTCRSKTLIIKPFKSTYTRLCRTMRSGLLNTIRWHVDHCLSPNLTLGAHCWRSCGADHTWTWTIVWLVVYIGICVNTAFTAASTRRDHVAIMYYAIKRFTQ